MFSREKGSETNTAKRQRTRLLCPENNFLKRAGVEEFEEFEEELFKLLEFWREREWRESNSEGSEFHCRMVKSFEPENTVFDSGCPKTHTTQDPDDSCSYCKN